MIQVTIAASVCTVLFATAPALAQGWLYGEEENPFTGKKDAWASILATKPTIGDQVLNPYMRLFVGCLEGELDYSIDAGAYIGNSPTPVRFRFDEATPVTERWVPSNDGSAVFVPRKYKDFRTGVAEADMLAFEVTDFRGVSYRSVFEGLAVNREVLDQVSAACE